MTLICSVVIPNKFERLAIVAWLHTMTYTSFFEYDDFVSISLSLDSEVQENRQKRNALMEILSQYPYFSIEQIDEGR